MAIKVQVKGDKQFDNTYADNNCCNGTFINDAYGVSPFTTTTLDGTYGLPFIGSQVPASLVSLYGNSFVQQPNFTGTKPFIGGAYGQNQFSPVATSVCPYTGQTLTGLNTYGVNPFTYGVNPFATTAVNAYGQIVPSIKTDINGHFPFQGWTVPTASDMLLGTKAASMNGLATQSLLQNPALASLAMTTPAWSAIKPSTLGASSLYPFGIQSQLNNAAFNPMLNALESTNGISPIAWQNASINPWSSIANSTLAGTTTPFSASWMNGLNSNVSSINPMMNNTVAQQAMMSNTVPVDVYENEDEFILLADMPGASIEDIDILVEGQSLIIKGIVKPMSWEKVGMGLNTMTLLQEKPAVKNIYRVFTLGTNVLTEKLTAKLSDGILTVKLPKVKVGYGSMHRVAVATA